MRKITLCNIYEVLRQHPGKHPWPAFSYAPNPEPPPPSGPEGTAVAYLPADKTYAASPRCRDMPGCDLYKKATQTIFGEGAAKAALNTLKRAKKTAA
ncbi:MAG: hypothetical protein M3N08_05280 [Pseudomonadota bacterium]|nr:hypothetical protein [Pseudomonadota bacterium]